VASRAAHHMSLIVHVTTLMTMIRRVNRSRYPRWLILGSRATCRIFKDLTLRLVKVAIIYTDSRRSLMMNQPNPHNDSQNAAEPLEHEIWDFARDWGMSHGKMSSSSLMRHKRHSTQPSF